jgi:hypothetical protein
MASSQNGKLTEWLVDKNVKFPKWQVGKMASWQKGKLEKWQVGKMVS